jgi:hypothetical protein
MVVNLTQTKRQPARRCCRTDPSVCAARWRPLRSRYGSVMNFLTRLSTTWSANSRDHPRQRWPSSRPPMRSDSRFCFKPGGSVGSYQGIESTRRRNQAPTGRSQNTDVVVVEPVVGGNGQDCSDPLAMATAPSTPLPPWSETGSSAYGPLVGISRAPSQPAVVFLRGREGGAPSHDGGASLTPMDGKLLLADE